MTVIIIETAPGVKFTNRKSEFDKGGYAGFLRKARGGVLFMDGNKEPQAFLSKNDGGFFVSAHASKVDGGKTRYMFGLMESTARFLGYSSDFDASDSRAMNKVAKTVIATHYPVQVLPI